MTRLKNVGSGAESIGIIFTDIRLNLTKTRKTDICDLIFIIYKGRKSFTEPRAKEKVNGPK